VDGGEQESVENDESSGCRHEAIGAPADVRLIATTSAPSIVAATAYAPRSLPDTVNSDPYALLNNGEAIARMPRLLLYLPLPLPGVRERARGRAERTIGRVPPYPEAAEAASQTCLRRRTLSSPVLLAVLLTLTLFLVWWAIGLAALVLLRIDTSSLRATLSAPALGTALTVMPLFVLSDLGASIATAGPIVGAVIVIAALVILGVKRPGVPLSALAVLGLAVVDLLLLGRPMFHFGFDWIADANGDMGFYVLAASQLAHHGLLSAVDVHALAHDRDLSTSAQKLDLEGIRPGAQISVAAVSAIVGRPAVEVYMPMLVALSMSGVCSAGALAMQASRRSWAAVVAAALLVVSPLAAYGVLQQLMPQVWGLTLAAALVSWLMRPEMHESPGPRIADLTVVAILTAALFVVYVELGSSVFVSYGIYVALLAWRRRISLRSLALLWTVPVLATIVSVNVYLSNELRYLHAVTSFGVSGSVKGLSIFGYAVVPTALPAITGLEKIASAPATRGMGLWLPLAALLLVGLVAVALVTAWRGSAAAVVLVGDGLIAVWLAVHGNDFGLFKLYMYIQPFVAAAIGAWLAGLKSRLALIGTAVLLVLVAGVQVNRLNAYVADSRNPVDLPHASGPDVLPAFRRLLATARSPIVSATENFTLLELQGSLSGDTPVHFLSLNAFNLPWKEKRFRLPAGDHGRPITFGIDPEASKALSRRSCTLWLPGGSQLPLNRRVLASDAPTFVVLPCGRTHNLLVFVTSNRGQPSTLPLHNPRDVSFWQLVQDPAFPGQTLSGVGRFALFQVLGPTPTVRVVLTLTSSPLQRKDGSHLLPPASVIGSSQVRFPTVGSGSARVISAPLRPRVIGGRPYLVLDMGEDGQLPVLRRPGLTGLWGKSIAIDPRFLTSYVRDVSLISPAEYRGLKLPRAIRRIPADLANPNLEYSGIYEDGWLGEDSYVDLAGGPATHLTLEALVPASDRAQALAIVVNGRSDYSQKVTPGNLHLRVRLPASRGKRRIELRWSSGVTLPAPDGRRVAAHLDSVSEA
jgi:hypothetical protein